MSSTQASHVSALLDGLASGAVRVVDLTQPLSETTPIIQLPPPFANTPGLSREEISRYDDRAYGAEVHHFAPMGHDVSLVQFPDADLAAIARAAGAQAAVIRRAEDLDVVDAWLAEPAPGPLVLDAKVNPTICAEWLAEAFRAG